jgi:hypothetical protein
VIKKEFGSEKPRNHNHDEVFVEMLIILMVSFNNAFYTSILLKEIVNII